MCSLHHSPPVSYMLRERYVGKCMRRPERVVLVEVGVVVGGMFA